MYASLPRSLVLAGLLLTILLVTKLVSLMNVGIDLTDEGYYLNWISNPWLYKYYVSQFGYIYHPVYQLLENDFVKLRVFNALFTYTLGFILSYLVIKRHTNLQRRDFLVISSAGIALPSLFILMITGHWVPSPSYNSLCFQGLLITVIGIILSESNFRNIQFLSALFIGLGGWLVCMAKPSSALLLSVVVTLYFVFEFKKHWRLLLGAVLVALSLVLFTAMYVDGGMLKFIQRYQMGLHLLDIMGSKHGMGNLLRLDTFRVSIADQFKLLLLMGLITGVFLSIQKGAGRIRNFMMTALFATIGYVLWLAFSTDALRINTPHYHPLILLAPLFAAIACWLFNKKTNIKLSRFNNKLILLFLVLPYIYAAGSGNNYWETSAGAILFWLLASLLILHKISPNHTQFIVLAAIVAPIAVKVLLDAQNSPYRQTEAIAQQSNSYIDPHTKKIMLLPKDTAIYLNDLSLLIQKTGFKPHTPVIDFTGHHPGTLYFMQANAIGQAWTIGGYDGSSDMAALALNQATCHEIANAWLIIEKDGRRRIDYRILEKHGVQANKSYYTKVGMIKTKVFTDWGFVNQSYPDGRYEQYFLKPNYPEVQEKSCLAFRQQHLNPRY